MMKYFVIFLFGIGLISCSGNTKENKGTGGVKDSAISNIANDNNENQQTEAGGTEKPIAITEKEFWKKIYDYTADPNWSYLGDKPCIVDFFADWCGPCRTIAPYMADFAYDYKNEIYVYKINIDFNKQLSSDLGIKSIPTVLFCPMKGKPTMIIGANSKSEYEKLIGEILLKK